MTEFAREEKGFLDLFLLHSRFPSWRTRPQHIRVLHCVPLSCAELDSSSSSQCSSQTLYRYQARTHLSLSRIGTKIWIGLSSHQRLKYKASGGLLDYSDQSLVDPLPGKVHSGYPQVLGVDKIKHVHPGCQRSQLARINDPAHGAEGESSEVQPKQAPNQSLSPPTRSVATLSRPQELNPRSLAEFRDNRRTAGRFAYAKEAIPNIHADDSRATAQE